MNMKEKLWDATKSKIIKKHLGYSDEDLQVFKNNPRNEEILAKAPSLMNKSIIFKVVESHGCNSQHKVGDKLYFDAFGNLYTERCPEKVCIYAMHAATPLIYAATELFFAGVDPNEMRFNRAACIDVGVNCGGWGRIVLELSIED